MIMKKFSKQTCMLLIVATLSMAAAQIFRHYTNESAADFLQGMGVGIMIGALILEKLGQKNAAATGKNK
jgi:hypothetical protein